MGEAASPEKRGAQPLARDAAAGPAVALSLVSRLAEAGLAALSVAGVL